MTFFIFKHLPLATATFEANSVKICANKQMRKSNNKNGRSLRLDKYVPNRADMPDSLPPLARAKPPPSKKIKLHGMFALTYFHVIKLGVVACGSLSGFAQKNHSQFQLAGNMNRAMTMKMAGVASPIFVFVINSAHPVMNPNRIKYENAVFSLENGAFTWCTQEEQSHWQQE